jgi:hypothetical protein
MPIMLYQLPNGKVVFLTIEEYLDLTDEDIQYLMALDFGEHIRDPFSGSAVKKNTKEKYYDFSSMNDEDIEDNASNNPFDDIIDLSDNLDT